MSSMSSMYSRMLAVLDQQFIFKHGVSSRVKKLTVAFDHKKRENVVTLEYRVKVDDDHEDSLGDDDYHNVGGIIKPWVFALCVGV